MSEKKPQERPPSKLCGAKLKPPRVGETCHQKAMANGRCWLHGGKSLPRMPTTGRDAAYIRNLGPRHAADREADLEALLGCGPELRLLDTFLIEITETLKDGLSGAWIADLIEQVDTLHVALFTQPDPGRVARTFTALRQSLAAGGAKMKAREEAVTVVKTRADIAIKADAVRARREQTVSDRDMVALFLRVPEVVAQVVTDVLRDGQWRESEPSAAGSYMARRVWKVLGDETGLGHLHRNQPDTPGAGAVN